MFNHYIALDWAQTNMAIARMTAKSNVPDAIDVPADLKELQLYLSRLKGSKILTFEETTTSQWLYTELKSFVDEIVVCDPYRNHLLSDGPKTDKMDAKKLVILLRGGLLKAVFHSGDEFIYLRKLVSGYEDTVKAGVRLQNQRAAIYRANGLSKNSTETLSDTENFVLEGIATGLNLYEEEKKRYEKEFKRLAKKNKMIKALITVPGFADINAVKTVARVVDPQRFNSRNHFWSYCGLIKFDEISGGRSYGKRLPRYCRTLKNVFRTAAFAAIRSDADNYFRRYYDYLIAEKKYPEHKARNAVARKIAAITLGVLKTGERFKNNELTRKLT